MRASAAVKRGSALNFSPYHRGGGAAPASARLQQVSKLQDESPFTRWRSFRATGQSAFCAFSDTRRHRLLPLRRIVVPWLGLTMRISRGQHRAVALTVLAFSLSMQRKCSTVWRTNHSHKAIAADVRNTKGFFRRASLRQSHCSSASSLCGPTMIFARMLLELFEPPCLSGYLFVTDRDRPTSPGTGCLRFGCPSGRPEGP